MEALRGSVALALITLGCQSAGVTKPVELPGEPIPFVSGVMEVSVLQAVITWPDLPRVVYGGTEDWVLRRTQSFDFGSSRKIAATSTFMGWDRGDIGEAHVIVYDERGVLVYSRSMHRQNGYDENYDAMHTASPFIPITTRRITVDLLVRCTGDNLNPAVYPRKNVSSVFFDASVRIFFGL